MATESLPMTPEIAAELLRSAESVDLRDAGRARLFVYRWLELRGWRANWGDYDSPDRGEQWSFGEWAEHRVFTGRGWRTRSRRKPTALASELLRRAHELAADGTPQDAKAAARRERARTNAAAKASRKKLLARALEVAAVLERDAVWAALRANDAAALARVVEPYADMVESRCDAELGERVVRGLTLDAPPVLTLYRKGADVSITSGPWSVWFRYAAMAGAGWVRVIGIDKGFGQSFDGMVGHPPGGTVRAELGAAVVTPSMLAAWCRVVRGYGLPAFRVPVSANLRVTMSNAGLARLGDVWADNILFHVYECPAP